MRRVELRDLEPRLYPLEHSCICKQEDTLNIAILHPGSRAQYKGIPETAVGRILPFYGLLGP